MENKLDLSRVRADLESLEDTIILSLFLRSKFKLNNAVYVPGAISIPNFHGSFFDFLFKGTEQLHALAGRYVDLEEHPFYGNPPSPIISRKKEDIGVMTVTNFNDEIKRIYFEALPKICLPGDDNKYGNAVLADISCLQSISKRVHMGEQVAEAKFQEEEQSYTRLVELGDDVGLIKKLTNTAVEERILTRVKIKGERYGVDPEIIVEFYKDKIIPLTKDVEVGYLIKRLKVSSLEVPTRREVAGSPKEIGIRRHEVGIFLDGKLQESFGTDDSSSVAIIEQQALDKIDLLKGVSPDLKYTLNPIPKNMKIVDAGLIYH